MVNYKIFNGIYNLNNKLKQIDDRYSLVFSPREKKFFLMVNYGLNRQKEMDFGRVLPSNLIERVRKSRVENMAQFFKNMDDFNEKLEKNAFFDVFDKTMTKVKEVVSYADRKNCDLSENEIARIING